MRRGISPVVGLVLLIAISLIAATGVWFWIGGYTGKPEVINVAYAKAALSILDFNGRSAVVKNVGGVVADSAAFVYNSSGTMVGYLALNESPLQPGESKVIDFVSNYDDLYAGEYVVVSDSYPMVSFYLPNDYLKPIWVVFFGSQDSHVYAVYSKNGSQYWNYTAGAGVPATVAIDNGVLYFGNEEGITALNASNGSKLWNYSKFNATQVGPFINNSVLYYTTTGSSNPNIAAALNVSLNFTGTDRKLWNYSEGTGGAHSAPVVVDDIMYFGGFNGENKVYALNASNGSLVCSFQMLDDTESSPLVYNDVVYIGSRDNRIYAINATNCSEIWEYPTNLTSDASYWVSSSPTMHNGILYIGADDANMTLALNATTGEKIWSFKGNSKLEISSPFYYEDKIFIGYFNGVLYVLNATNGSYLWNYSTGDSYRIGSSPIVFRDVLYFGSDNGKLYAVNVTSHDLIWSYTTGGSIVSSPVLCNIRTWHCLYPTVSGMNNTAS